MNNYNTNYFTQTAAQTNANFINNKQQVQQSATSNPAVNNNINDTKPKLNKIDIAAVSAAALAIVTAGVCLYTSGKTKKALNSLQQTAASLQDNLSKTQNELIQNQTELQKAKDTIAQIQNMADKTQDELTKKQAELQKARDAVNLLQQKQQGLADNLLFPNGIQGIEFKQSNIGDCYLLSSLYALSKKPMGESIIKKMVTMTGDGDFIVKFGNYKPIKVTAAELKGQGSRRSVSADIGVQAIERAYGKYRKALQTQQQHNAAMGYSLMAIDGGLCDDVLKFINSNFTTKVYGSSQYGAFERQKENIPYILDNLAKNFDKKVICASTPQAQFGRIQETHNGKQYGWMDRSKKLICQHAYAITGIDSVNKIVTVANPHNTEKPLKISYDDFTKAFDRIFTAY